MNGEEFVFKILPVNNTLPYYFDEEDIMKIFIAASPNIKHLSMLKVLFYCCLRASEICRLEDMDVNFKAMTIKVREGKMAKDGIVYLTEDCVRTLKRYLEIRPKLEINGKTPIFYTDYNNLWDRRDVYRMFIHYKTLAGISKPGGVHVFARHSPGCLMIKKGVDLRIVKEILRHKTLQSTLRYTFVADETKRAAYDKAMNL
jgi:integrase/recombinase XerD